MPSQKQTKDEREMWFDVRERWFDSYSVDLALRPTEYEMDQVRNQVRVEDVTSSSLSRELLSPLALWVALEEILEIAFISFLLDSPTGNLQS